MKPLFPFGKFPRKPTRARAVKMSENGQEQDISKMVASTEPCLVHGNPFLHLRGVRHESLPCPECWIRKGSRHLEVPVPIPISEIPLQSFDPIVHSCRVRQFEADLLNWMYGQSWGTGLVWRELG